MKDEDVFSLEELVKLSGLTVRTVRYYIQKGLVDRPIGEKRGAYYKREHLQQLLTIKKWADAGMSLSAISALLNERSETAELPFNRRKPGDIEVKSHIFLGDGIELMVDPVQAQLSTENLRSLVRKLKAVIDSEVGDK